MNYRCVDEVGNVPVWAKEDNLIWGNLSFYYVRVVEGGRANILNIVLILVDMAEILVIDYKGGIGYCIIMYRWKYQSYWHVLTIISWYIRYWRNTSLCVCICITSHLVYLYIYITSRHIYLYICIHSICMCVESRCFARCMTVCGIFVSV